MIVESLRTKASTPLHRWDSDCDAEGDPIFDCGMQATARRLADEVIDQGVGTGPAPRPRGYDFRGLSGERLKSAASV
jgi:hypothetical protein